MLYIAFLHENVVSKCLCFINAMGSACWINCFDDFNYYAWNTSVCNTVWFANYMKIIYVMEMINNMVFILCISDMTHIVWFHEHCHHEKPKQFW